MSPLRLTEPFPNLQDIRSAISLQESLNGHHPPGTALTGYLGEAAPGVFGPAQTWTAKFLFIEGVYYFFFEGELAELAVGDYVEATLEGVRLVVRPASYPMVQFDFAGFFFTMRADFGNPDQALAGLPGKRTFPTGVTSYTIGKAGPNNGTRIVIYDIPDGAPAEAFAPHLHTHGEMFIVVAGCIRDEHGDYGFGQLVVVGPNTFHRPTAKGRTVIVVAWTGGITSPPE